MAGLVLHLGHQDRLALQRRRARDPVALGQHADDLGMRVLRNLPDQRLAVRLRHPVLRLDLDVGVDPLLKRAFLGRHFLHGAQRFAPVSTICAYIGCSPRRLRQRLKKTIHFFARCRTFAVTQLTPHGGSPRATSDPSPGQAHHPCRPCRSGIRPPLRRAAIAPLSMALRAAVARAARQVARARRDSDAAAAPDPESRARQSPRRYSARSGALARARCAPASDTATPLAPARPVRPMRCT